MKIVLDNNLPHSLARLLTQRGFEATHILELGLADASDIELRNRLADEKIVFVSRDGDFWLNHPEGWAVVWVALHNPTLASLKGSVFEVLVKLLPELQPGDHLLVASDQVRRFGGPQQ